MPHEVIMPALGMAQDTGTIVQWLKASGDAVTAGDALFEVETDKATMEIEAQADGFLSDLRAEAGADVPVGQVIALIVASAEAVAENSAPAQPPTPAQAEADPADAPDRGSGHDIIMPALGMAQDTGLIVAWHKAPGDAVAEDEVLLEVETDKSTMEIPAGVNGYVAALLAEAGEEVPVGIAIAVISREKPSKPIQRTSGSQPSLASDKPQAPAKPEPEPAQTAIKPASSEPKPSKAPHRNAVSDGRIFASPKARRLAAEAGLDLGRLAAFGHPQPYHAEDVAFLRTLPVETAAAAPARPTAQQITASVPRMAHDAFLHWLKDEAPDVTPARLWASFAAGSLRASRDGAADLVVASRSERGAGDSWRNPDHVPLLTAPENAGDLAPDLILRDLSATAITGTRLGSAAAPLLTVTACSEALHITLDFTDAQLDDSTAIDLMSGFTQRLNDPLVQLL